LQEVDDGHAVIGGDEDAFGHKFCVSLRDQTVASLRGWNPRAVRAKPCGLDGQVGDLRMHSNGRLRPLRGFAKRPMMGEMRGGCYVIPLLAQESLREGVHILIQQKLHAATDEI
jgi:hypothetical protein